MNKNKLSFCLGCCLMAYMLLSSTAVAQVPTNVWVDCNLHIIQTGMQDGQEDTRMFLSAINGAFTNTWLIVDRSAAKMVAATALTAYSLGKDIRVRIVPYGSGYRIDAVRILP
jgi:hypothetical protein